MNIISIGLILLFFTFGCSSKDRSKQLIHFRGFAHTMPYHIQIGHSLSPFEKREVKRVIDEVFLTVDRVYNHWNAESELSRFNAAPLHQKIPISSELLALIHLSKSISDLTEGRFDPTLGTLIKRWKRCLPEGAIPTMREIDQLSSGWTGISYVAPSSLIRISPISLDLDGIAKGYAVDTLTEKIHALGYTNIYVDWSGDIRTLGDHPTGRSWQILLPTLTTDSTPPPILPLKGGALATSGDYIQAWNVSGVTYSHIINPKTNTAIARKQASIAAVTIYAPTCAFADALATACMTFEAKEKALEWIETLQHTYPDIHCWILSYEENALRLSSTFTSKHTPRPL